MKWPSLNIARKVRRAARRYGWLIQPDKFTAKYLRNYNFKISTLIDIGVGTGTPSLYEAFAGIPIVMIDPHPDTKSTAAQYLVGRNLLISRAVGETDGIADLHIAGNKSSLQTRIIPKKDHFQTAEVVVSTLDHLCEEYKLAGPFGIKIDTEGYELSVIRGAGKTLKTTAFVIAEVSMKERFIEGYDFLAFLSEMAKHNFVPTDILSYPQHSRYFDVLFVSKHS